MAIKKATQSVAFKSTQSDGQLGRTSSETLINLIIINFQAVTLKVTSCHCSVISGQNQERLRPEAGSRGPVVV